MTRRAFEYSKEWHRDDRPRGARAAKIHRKRPSDELDAEHFPVSTHDLTVSTRPCVACKSQSQFGLYGARVINSDLSVTGVLTRPEVSLRPNRALSLRRSRR